MKDGLKLKLGDATRVTPRNIQEVQASKLGDAQGIALVFGLLDFLSFMNKLVRPPLSYIGFQIVWFGLEKSRKVHAYVVKRACF